MWAAVGRENPWGPWTNDWYYYGPATDGVSTVWLASCMLYSRPYAHCPEPPTSVILQAALMLIASEGETEAQADEWERGVSGLRA